MLIHAYFGVDLDIVWGVVTTKVPSLLAAILELSGTDPSAGLQPPRS